jgi:hypothetical protein
MRVLLLIALCVGFVVLPLSINGFNNALSTPATALSTSYFPLLPFGASESTPPQFIPVASNHALESSHHGIRRAIIVIHDSSRDAETILTTLTKLAGSNDESTIVLAPQFLLDTDIMRFANQLPEHGQSFARWPLDGWVYGGTSISAPSQQGISAYTVIDLLLMYLGERKFFPDLQRIVIAGHGFGGDFVQRYAAVGQAPELLDKQNVSIQFVIANPSSFLFFTAQRPKPNKQGLGSPDSTLCQNYNAYPYGLEQLNDYARRSGANAIKLRYASRSITYLIGAQVAQNDPLPDNNCSALLEGADRVTRAANYNVYLHIVFGDDVDNLHQFVTIPTVGYDSAPLFSSPCGMAGLFEEASCHSSKNP